MAVLALSLVVGSSERSRASGELTGVETLRTAYDAVLNARFDRAERLLERACGPAPPEACLVLQATSLWWQIVLNPRDTSRDPAFLARVEAAIAACELWTQREPERAEAWFYLGAAYGARVSWRVERSERLAAARDGKRIKESLERALAIAPGLQDARFGIGLYKYYADVAPAVVRFRRFLLLLPGGDRAAGLADMEAASARGQLVVGEAEYQLHWIYFWYENQPQRGLARLEHLRARYPSNPHFLQRIAEVRETYFHDPAGSLAAWRTLAETASQSGAPEIAEVTGRLGMAAQLDRLFETDRALEQLQQVLALKPRTPLGARAQAHLQLGLGLERLGRTDEARLALRTALAALPPGDPDEIGDQARAALRRSPAGRQGEAYRLSLQGWRALETGAAEPALRLLEQAATLAPADGMIRARLGRAYATHNDSEAALRELNRVIAARATVSPIALGSAYLWSGDVFRGRGDLHAAAERYREAARVFGTDARIARAASRALARLGPQ